MEQKKCVTCEQEKDISEFYFSKIQNMYDSYCRSCRNAYMRKYFKTRQRKLDRNNRNKCKYKCYAVYKGNDFIYMGTAYECAEAIGVIPKTIYFYNTKTYKKRIVDKPNSIVVEVIED